MEICHTITGVLVTVGVLKNTKTPSLNKSERIVERQINKKPKRRRTKYVAN